MTRTINVNPTSEHRLFPPPLRQQRRLVRTASRPRNDLSLRTNTRPAQFGPNCARSLKMISAFPHEAPEPLVSIHTESCDPPDAARDAPAVFAHELRSPLAAALQGLQLLCLSRADQAVAELSLDQIQRQLRHAARLVEVTLADARGQSATSSLHRLRNSATLFLGI